MPTGHDCEDDECVDGSATVYVAGLIAPIGTFSSTHVQLFVFISEVTAVSIGTYGTRVSLALFPGSSSL